MGTRLTGTARLFISFVFLFFSFSQLAGARSSVIGYVLNFPFCGNLVERHRISSLTWCFTFLIFLLIIQIISPRRFWVIRVRFQSYRFLISLIIDFHSPLQVSCFQSLCGIDSIASGSHLGVLVVLKCVISLVAFFLYWLLPFIVVRRVSKVGFEVAVLYGYWLLHWSSLCRK